MTRDRNSHFTSGHGLGDIEGPSDAELSDIEAEPASKDYSDASIEAHREAYAKIDPMYAKVRNSRKKTTAGGVAPREFSGTDISSRIGEESVGVGGMLSSQAGDTQVSSDFDAADFRPARRATGLGGVGGDEGYVGASAFERMPARSEQEKLARNQGQFLVKLAGRCDHPICAARRAKGLELLGRPAEGRGYGAGESSGLPAIPSTVTEKSYYPVDPKTGKEMRSQSKSYKEYKVAPEGKAEFTSLSSYLAGAGAGAATAEDFLQHHHTDDDMHYLLEHGMPWDN